MTCVYVGSFPPDPEADRKNFQRKQSEYEAAYRRTGEPLALLEALMNAGGYLQFPLELNWLIKAVSDTVLKNRTDQTAERFKERMRHVQRYRCVRDLRRKGHKKERALDLAVAALAATDAAAARPTIADSYDKVRQSLDRKKHESEYYYLVARADPTRVPVHVVQLPGGGVAINGVTFRPQGVIVRSTVTGGDR